MVALQWSEKKTDCTTFFIKSTVRLYFCSSRRLNLVDNNAKKLPKLRNTIATVKDIILFSVNRNAAPNLPALCETRWFEKYRNIRKLSDKFYEIVENICRSIETFFFSIRRLVEWWNIPPYVSIPCDSLQFFIWFLSYI